MTSPLCPFCGWGSQIKSACTNSTAAETCELNLENVRKFQLRFRNEPLPNIVRSIRYQDPTKSKWGAYYEHLERVE